MVNKNSSFRVSTDRKKIFNIVFKIENKPVSLGSGSKLDQNIQDSDTNSMYLDLQLCS